MHPVLATQKSTSSGTPYTEVTEPICRVPSTKLVLHTLGFSPRGTSAGSGYGYSRFISAPFSRAPGISGIPQRETILSFRPVLIITILPGSMLISVNDGLRPPSQKRLKQNLCCHAYLNSSGILTGRPFLTHQLDARLGPTDPWLIDIAKEPLPFQWS